MIISLLQESPYSRVFTQERRIGERCRMQPDKKIAIIDEDPETMEDYGICGYRHLG